MPQSNDFIKFLLALFKTQAMLARNLDRGLNGISLNEFLILHTLHEQKDGKLCGIEMANRLGLTASAITRLLLPMEKIGLIKRETRKDDARISNIVLAPGGKLKMEEALEKIQYFATEKIQFQNSKTTENTMQLLEQISKNF